MKCMSKATEFAIVPALLKEGEGVYILNRATEKRQKSGIQRIVWLFQLLLAGVVVNVLEGPPCIALDRFHTAPSILIYIHIATLSLRMQK